MKKIFIFIFIFVYWINICFTYYNGIYWPLKIIDKKIISFKLKKCLNIKQKNIPTILIPWILASWYSEEWYDKYKIKRWLPDPVTHSYDTLIYTFKKNNYNLKDVFYEKEFQLKIVWNPKQSLYIFWYDWKKDNKISATLLSELTKDIRSKYIKYNGCDIWKVNIIAHSMWWLVARAFLEDMCIKYENNNNIIKINNYDNKLKNWKLIDYTSWSCNNNIKINKLITLSTPNRWSPKSYVIWEKWELDKVESFFTALPLKLQLWNFTNKSFYNLLHWYDKNLPNWIITIWQLLPDIYKNNNYNKLLNYLYNDTNLISNYFHPWNSFLEELNKIENINKIWNKIEKTYTIYYSNVIWNIGNNNIIWYNLKDIEIINSKNIYDKYSKNINTNNLKIDNTIRNNQWLWGDWTVPSLNLFLVPNNTNNWKHVSNKKLKLVKVKCDEWVLWKDLLKQTESKLYKKLWKEWKFEICSHSKIPIATSIKVYHEIIKENNSDKSKKNIINERYKLLSNLWYVDYTDNYSKEKDSNIIIYKWIDYDFSNNYNKHLSNIDIIELEANDKKRISLSFWWEIKNLLRYDILSPINISIKNELWQKIWINNETWFIENTIPWAYTSWNTEWSWEWEFFLIPIIWTWEINHKIQTYWTGNWKYTILVNKINKTNNLDQLLKIIWTANKWFWENININWVNNDYIYKNITNDIPTTLELNNSKIVSRLKDINIKYNIRWKNIWINKIQYKLFKNNDLIKEEKVIINWIINLNFEEIWKYILNIEILDNNWNILDNIESKKEIYIEINESITKYIKNNWIKNLIFEINDSKIILNNVNNNLKYKKWLNWELFLFLKDKIYKIDSNKYKRKLISHDDESLQKILNQEHKIINSLNDDYQIINLDYNPEFEEKYKLKLNLIRNKIFNLNQIQKNKLDNYLKNNKNKYIKKIKNKNKKEKIIFLINKIEKYLSL